MLLGAAVGLGAALAMRTASVRRGTAATTACGAVAGLLIALLGGRLMFGSLAALTRDFSGSRLRLDQIELLFGEAGFGDVTRFVTTTFEAALFSGGVVAAMMIAERRLGGSR
jgi:hypothetical protein